ncbi:MAG: SUMF1/EgtB/PvdO family nonheme iron enzyme, partial [Myxococcota bacterium]|nr:SUMF1/EgtB/PvdO family nonheme iron enzyme [Myxococcota bacterium]
SERDQSPKQNQTRPEAWQTIAANQNTIPGVQEWKNKEPISPHKSGGQRIGSYNILGEIGQGGMGVVYRARHIEEAWAKRQGGDVAIKMMHARFARDPSFRERFIREASVGRNIEHPSANKVHEVVIDGDMIGIVMDLIEGYSLQGNIPSSGMNLEKALSILKPVASALDHLHSKGIIHRDLKPENIRIRHDGTPVILDFGIAKQENDQSGMTQTGVLMGTVSYMAPEQIDAKNVSASADRYALGVIAYELLSGQKPWSSDLADGRIFAMKLAGNLIHLSKRTTEVPKYISAAVMRMLSLDPKARFNSSSAFIEALEGIGDNTKISAADRLADLSHEEREKEFNKARKQYTELMAQLTQIEVHIAGQRQLISTAMRERDESLLKAEQQFSGEKKRLASSRSDQANIQDDRVAEITAQIEGKKLALVERLNRLKTATEVSSSRARHIKQEINTQKGSLFSFMGKRKLAVLEAKYEEEKKKLNMARQKLREAEESHEDSLYNLDEELRTTVQTYHRKNTHDNEQLRFKTSQGVSNARKVYVEFKERVRAQFASKQHAAEAMIIGFESELKSVKKEIAELKNEYPPEVWIMTTVHKVGAERLEMAQIPAGEYIMGANKGDPSALIDESPRHEVELTHAFWMSTTPVSQSLFQSVTGKNPSEVKGTGRPVEKVSWNAAIEFCNKLSEQLGFEKAYRYDKKTKKMLYNPLTEGFRLPTEAEWEYAARAGDMTLYAGSDQPGEVAWYADNSGSGVQELAMKRRNKFALYDMSGNVWEWCWDYYGDYTAASVKDPVGPDIGRRRVRRGGSNRNRLQHIRVSNRAASNPDTIQAGIGFRVVRTML